MIQSSRKCSQKMSFSRYLKITIHLHSLIPPKMGNFMIPENAQYDIAFVGDPGSLFTILPIYIYVLLGNLQFAVWLTTNCTFFKGSPIPIRLPLESLEIWEGYGKGSPQKSPNFSHSSELMFLYP